MADELPTGFIDLSAEDYHADRSAVSKSWLDQIDRSPAHLRAYLDGQREETPAMTFGRLVHCAVLEPDLLDDQFAVIPSDINRRTKVGKEEFTAWEKEHAHHTIVTSAQLADAKAIRDSVLRSKAASALLGKGAPEQSVVWIDSQTGERCKARADWLRDSVIVDVKTTQDARPDAFMRSIANYRYDVQAAHYGRGFERERFAFIAVEKTPPYGVAVYLADDTIRERGQEARIRNLETYGQCRESGEWPGYPDIVTGISLPAWARSAA